MGIRFSAIAFTLGAVASCPTIAGSLSQLCGAVVFAIGSPLAAGRLECRFAADATSRARIASKLDTRAAAITTKNLRRRQNRADGDKPNSTSQNVADRSWEEHVQFLRGTYSLYSTWQFQNGSNFSRRKCLPPWSGGAVWMGFWAVTPSGSSYM